MTDGAGSSAVLLCVPEAEPVVHAWRSTGDLSAARGVPAHVTLLSPFLPADRIDAGVHAELAWFFGGVDAFRLCFSAVGCFEDAGVLFLEPDGDGLDQLGDALARRWPETPPYDGKHRHPHPHLTVVHTDDDELHPGRGGGRAAPAADGPGLACRAVDLRRRRPVERAGGVPFGQPE